MVYFQPHCIFANILFINNILFETVISASKQVAIEIISIIRSHGCVIRPRSLILALLKAASATSSEVLMCRSRRRAAINREVAINRAAACHEVTWRDGARNGKKDGGWGETGTARMWKSLTKATISLIPSRVTSETSVFALPEQLATDSAALPCCRG